MGVVRPFVGRHLTGGHICGGDSGLHLSLVKLQILEL